MTHDVILRAALAVNAAAAAAAVVPQTQLSVPSDPAGFFDWLVRGALAISLALNTYFLRGLAKTVKDCTDTSNEHKTRLAVLEARYDLWMQYEHDEKGLDRRRGERRRHHEHDDESPHLRREK